MSDRAPPSGWLFGEPDTAYQPPFNWWYVIAFAIFVTVVALIFGN